MSARTRALQGGRKRGAAPAGGEHRFLRAVGAASVTIATVSLITVALSHWGFLRVFETASLDTWLRLKSPLRASDVVIVGIDDCDYRDLFRAVSPLDPRALWALLDAVAAGKPRVIGVDLDTSSRSFTELQPSGNWPPVVWARGLVSVEDEAAGGCIEGLDELPSQGSREGASAGRPSASDAKNVGGEPPKMVPLAFLGRHEKRPDLHSGIAVFPQDPDGGIRRYRRLIDTSDGPLPSFPWEVVRLASRQQGVTADTSGAELVLNFSGNRFSFPRIAARNVLIGARAEGWAMAGPLKDRVVLVGGLYRAARDEYATPVGPMAGVELNAQAIETELQGKGIRAANEALMVLLEILGGVCLVLVHHRYRLRTALLVSLLAMPTMALIFSFASFATFARWANFIPILVAVLIHQLYHHAKDYRRLYLAAAQHPGTSEPSS